MSFHILTRQFLSQVPGKRPSGGRLGWVQMVFGGS
jgi:hypothetical protein